MSWRQRAPSSVPAEPATVEAPHLLSSVERADPPLRFSRLNPVDALNARAGNRFDVPGAGVLYGATAAAGAYAETLAGFRRKASIQHASPAPVSRRDASSLVRCPASGLPRAVSERSAWLVCCPSSTWKPRQRTRSSPSTHRGCSCSTTSRTSTSLTSAGPTACSRV
ncbi:RES domain-containing protein [Herbiconiux ginsengi]|uniref:RES domain-containing protein n=1 Tax=Herbiconiux ginsengi TaxID=381665 RepID=UPI001114E2A2